MLRKQTVEEVRKAEVAFEGVPWENISADAKDFVLSLLKKDPMERLTAKAALKHPFIMKRTRLSTNVPDPQLADNIKTKLQRYVDSSDFKKIALLAIANRMSSEEIVELRKVFSEFDTSSEGTISKEEFNVALFKHGKHTEDEIESLFSGIDVNQTDTILYTGTCVLFNNFV
jgi:calcium-dependent protein kinase